MLAPSIAAKAATPIKSNEQLVELAKRVAPESGVFETDVPGLTLYRTDSSMTCHWSVCEPSLSFIIQGSKTIRFGDHQIEFPPLNYMVANVHLPVQVAMIDATPKRPYLGAKLTIDPKEVTDLILEFGSHLPKAEKDTACPNGGDCGMCRTDMGQDMQDALQRLLVLADQPDDIPALAPMARREIFYRALMGEFGPRIRRFATSDTQAHRISQVIAVLQDRFTEPLRVGHLAEQANMSESALFHAFKRVTRMSPLQFQKKLRLHEARRLMLTEGLEAASASYRVGYESPSQFSREYSRLFGAPPRADVVKLREASESVRL